MVRLTAVEKMAPMWPVFQLPSPALLGERLTTAAAVRERFRHRYEVDPRYIDRLEQHGLIFSGRHPTQPIMQILELPLPVQAKLLWVLQERTVDRVGGREPVEVDLRVVATTNVNLGDAVRQGRFRADLFYRLNVVSLRLPPLRERPEDIPFLAEIFCRSLGGGRATLTPAALERLALHDWPGNVRELRNVVERALLLLVGDEIRPADLFADPPASRAGDPGAGRATVESMEKDLILKTLGETGGNRTRAAEKLGISVRTLRNKLGRYRRDAAASGVDGDAVLKALRARMDPGRYNGASLLGLRGIVIKSHGSADVFAFGKALERALEEVQNDVIERIQRRMAQLHPAAPPARAVSE